MEPHFFSGGFPDFAAMALASRGGGGTFPLRRSVQFVPFILEFSGEMLCSNTIQIRSVVTRLCVRLVPVLHVLHVFSRILKLTFPKCQCGSYVTILDPSCLDGLT